MAFGYEKYYKDPLRKLRCSLGRGEHPWTAFEDKRLRGLTKSGMSIADIAKELNRSVSAIHQRRSRLGMTKQVKAT